MAQTTDTTTPAGAQNTVSSDGTPNTVSSDGTPNTGGQEGQPTQSAPQQFDVQTHINRGFAIGVEKTLARLGLPGSIDDAVAMVGQMRGGSPGRSQDNPATGRVPQDVANAPQFQAIAQRLGSVEGELNNIRRENEILKEQASKARELEIKTLATARGVGPGMQLESFIRLFGDKLQYGPDRTLQVMGQLPDGTAIPSGQSVEDYIGDALQKCPFLAPAPQTVAHGSGSRLSPTSPPIALSEQEENRRSILEAIGITSDGKRISRPRRG